MLNSKWQLWVHTPTQQPVFVGPTPQGLLMRHPTTKRWVDAVLAYHTGEKRGDPAHVWAHADFVQEHRFVRAIEEEELQRRAGVNESGQGEAVAAVGSKG